MPITDVCKEKNTDWIGLWGDPQHLHSYSSDKSWSQSIDYHIISKKPKHAEGLKSYKPISLSYHRYFVK